MNTKQLEQNNINNLRNLFKTMGSTTQAYSENKSIEISNTWPSRIWTYFDEGLNDTQALIKHALSTSRALTISLCDKQDENTSLSIQALEDSGFAVTFEQVAMVLDVNESLYERKGNLEIKYIKEKNEIETWVDIASTSFSNSISSEVIQAISKDKNVYLLLAYEDNVPVGTALAFNNCGVIGIHLVGVPTKNRGKGIAQSIMVETIELAKREKVNYMTLQASQLGLGIYKRLGFKEQFVLKNYMKKTK